jgi:hypothetical protein
MIIGELAAYRRHNIEGKSELSHRQERMSMMLRDAVLGDPGEVRRRRVPDVALPSVTRMAHGERAHDAIACHLRDDRRARDAVTACVTIDDRGMRRP